jgi:hypothetical protein
MGWYLTGGVSSGDPKEGGPVEGIEMHGGWPGVKVIQNSQQSARDALRIVCECALSLVFAGIGRIVGCSQKGPLQTQYKRLCFQRASVCHLGVDKSNVL